MTVGEQPSSDTLIERESFRSRASVVALAIAASLLLSGCPPQEPADAEYPRLETALSSIDWLGDGSVPESIRIQPGGNRLPIRVVLDYPADDNVALELLIEERLRPFPTLFPVFDDREFGATYGSDDLDYGLYVTIAEAQDGTPAVSIRFDTIADDRRASGLLGHIAEALGTIP